MSFRSSSVAPHEVHETLRRHMLVDGYHIVVDLERSRGSFMRDAATGHEYLDFCSFYASNPIGLNHPGMLDERTQARLARAATMKPSNADFYSTFMAELVDTLARTAAPAELPHYFFIEGGALAVENAMKTAFDWKVRKNMAAGRGEQGSRVLHLENAFHGRSGYTLSVTNTDPVKTDLFPKFDWPRIPCPKVRFPLEGKNLEAAVRAEREAIARAEAAFDRYPFDIAAILVEPIQAEGGDNHCRPDFFRELRRLADEREAFLIYDEVQTGLGITGRWWAYEHHGVAPDALCFAKKMQLGGILVSKRVDEVADNVFVKPSRINSTFGGNLVDMVRATRILEIIVEENLLDNAAARGTELLAGLRRVEEHYPEAVTNARGLGLMCAIDLPDAKVRGAIIRRCMDVEHMVVLPSGPRAIRFRPSLTVKTEEVLDGIARLDRAIGAVLRG